MERLLNLMGMFIGGWLGWELGEVVSVFTAFVVSMIGTGVGLYAALRVSRELMP